jgi:hypothetical protein
MGVARRGRAVSKERIVIVAKIGPPCSAKVFTRPTKGGQPNYRVLSS